MSKDKLTAIIVGANIKALRLENKYSLQVLADFTSISKGYLHDVEQGKSNITLAKASRLAATLHVSLDVLIGSEYTNKTLTDFYLSWRNIENLDSDSLSIVRKLITLLVEKDGNT